MRRHLELSLEEKADLVRRVQGLRKEGYPTNLACMEVGCTRSSYDRYAAKLEEAEGDAEKAFAPKKIGRPCKSGPKYQRPTMHADAVVLRRLGRQLRKAIQKVAALPAQEQEQLRAELGEWLSAADRQWLEAFSPKS